MATAAGSSSAPAASDAGQRTPPYAGIAFAGGQSAGVVGRARSGSGLNWHVVNPGQGSQSSSKDEQLSGDELDHALLEAIKDRNASRVQQLLKRNANVDKTDEHDLSLLHHAVLAGSEETLEILLKSGVDVNRASSKWGTPLTLATLKGRPALVYPLLKHKADVNQVTDFYGTALHCAAWTGKQDILSVLLQRGGKPEVAADVHLFCYQPAQQWSGNGSPPTASVQNALISCINCTPLFIAIEKGLKPVFDALLENGAPVDASCGCRYGSVARDEGPIPFSKPKRVSKQIEHTTLTMSVDKRKRMYMQSLIKKGAKVDAPTPEGLTPLAHSAAAGILDCMKELLDSGASVDRKGQGGRTPLIDASRCGQAMCVRALSEKGASLEATDDLGRTALWWAAAGNDKVSASHLLDAGADVNTKDMNGVTPLLAAMKRGHLKTISFLVKKRATAQTRANDGTSAIRLILQQYLAEDFTDKLSDLIEAVIAPQIGELFQFGGNPSEIIPRFMQSVKSLVQKDKSAPDASTLEVRLIYNAAGMDVDNLLNALIKLGGNVDTQDVDGWTALHLAAMYGNVMATNRLLSKRAVMHLACNDTSSEQRLCPLGVAARYRQESAAQVLLLHGASVERMRECDLGPLHVAAQYGSAALVKIIHGAGARLADTDANGRTALHIAAARGDFKIVQYLVDSKANLAAEDNEGQTPALLARESKRDDMVDFLTRVSRGEDVRAPASPVQQVGCLCLCN